MALAPWKKKILSEINGNQGNLRYAFRKVFKTDVEVPPLVLTKRAKCVCVKSQNIFPASSILGDLRFS
jgi:hypothetical protein